MICIVSGIQMRNQDFCFNIWKKRQNLPGGGFVLLIKTGYRKGDL